LLNRLWVLPILAVLALGLVAAACGDDDDGEPSATQAPGASPTAAGPAATGTPAAGAKVVEVIADAEAFNRNSIEVTAGQQFTVNLVNMDTVSHTFDIYTEEGGEEIAGVEPSPVRAGNTSTLTTTIEEPGEYYFQCDIHPTTMNGTLTVN
jgi:plastocyanin